METNESAIAPAIGFDEEIRPFKIGGVLQAPQTLLATSDSPVGLATMFLDHDQPSLSLIRRVFMGVPEGLTRDDVLDNITLCWLTNTAVSGYRLYWENKHAFVAPLGVKVPVVVSAFPEELFQAPQSWAEKAYPGMIYYKKHTKGGHFAAWEQPDLFALFQTNSVF